MAYIERRILKSGGYSYRISAYHNGTRHRMNFRADANLTEHQSDKAAEHAARQFEEELKRIWFRHADKDVTMADWIDYVLKQKSVAGRKKKTISDYNYMSVRIKKVLGNLRVSEICPADIMRFFGWLTDEVLSTGSRAVKKPDVDLLSAMQNEQFSRSSLGRTAMISQATVANAVNGKHIALSSAEKIAKALSYDVSELFDVLCPARKLSLETKKDYRRFLSLILSAAQREGIIVANPMAQIDRPLVENVHEPQCLQPDEMQMILEAVKQEPIQKQCLVHLLMVTGCRRGEIAGLRWSRVFWNDGLIKIDRTIQYTPQDGAYEESTKTRQERLIRLPAETLELLHEYREWQKKESGEDCEYVFTNRKGQHINPDFISNYLRKFQQKYHLSKLHPHLFRHTMASILYYAGQDPVSISKRLGHANVSTTQNIYSHLIRQADTESAEMIAEAILRQQKK